MKVLLAAMTMFALRCGGRVCPTNWGEQCQAPLVKTYAVNVFVPATPLLPMEAILGTLKIQDQRPHDATDESLALRYSDVAGEVELEDGQAGTFTGVVNEQLQCLVLDFKVQRGHWHWQGAVTKNAEGKTLLDFHHTGNLNAEKCHNGIQGVGFGAPEGWATEQ